MNSASLTHISGQIAWLSTTVGSESAAQTLAAAGVQARLAACAQVDAIQSTYWWDGALQQSAEWRITYKTTTEQLSALQTALQAVHPYTLAQWLSGHCHASPAYAQWVAAEVARPVQA